MSASTMPATLEHARDTLRALHDALDATPGPLPPRDDRTLQSVAALARDLIARLDGPHDETYPLLIDETIESDAYYLTNQRGERYPPDDYVRDTSQYPEPLEDQKGACEIAQHLLESEGWSVAYVYRRTPDGTHTLVDTLYRS